MIAKMAGKDVWPLLKQTGSEWAEDKAPKMAAALAYYSAISIAPLLVIAMGLVTMFYGDKAPDKLRGQIATLTDPSVAATLQSAITNAHHSGAGLTATVISLGVAIVGASGVFAELQDSLNTIWEVRPKPNRGFWGLISDRFLSITMVGGIAFLLLVSTVVSALLTGVSGQLISQTVGTNGFAAKVISFVLEVVLSTGVVTVLFAAMFKFLPDVKIKWRDVWLGGFFTAILFEIGKHLLGFYLGKAAPGSAFGAVGSIVAMLVWIYYSAQILFFGAEFTQVYANKYGTHIVPAANAEPLTEEMRQQAGIPHAPDSASAPTKLKPRTTPRPHRRPLRTMPVARPVSLAGRTFTEVGLPTLALVVIGRFAWKRLHVVTAPAKTTRDLWGDAWKQWKKVGRVFVVPTDEAIAQR